MLGETSQELKEGTAGHTGNVQVLGHEVPHSTGLRQPWWVRDTWFPWLKCEKLIGVQAQHLAELLGVGLRVRGQNEYNITSSKAV